MSVFFRQINADALTHGNTSAVNLRWDVTHLSHVENVYVCYTGYVMLTLRAFALFDTILKSNVCHCLVINASLVNH